MNFKLKSILLEQNDRNEIIGRLMFWKQAISHSIHLLEDAAKAKEAKQRASTNSNSYPKYIDCCAIYDSFIELAIVYFCQLFNRGDSKIGEASNNKNALILFNEILIKVIPVETERMKFNELKDEIVIIRNGIIGHTDANNYSISHGNKITVLSGPTKSWRELDLLFWQNSLYELEDGIANYINKIKMENK